MRFFAVVFVIGALMSACSVTPNHEVRQSHADAIAVGANLQAQSYSAAPFTLAGYQRIGTPHAPLTVYIEGDGYAWATPDRPSSDPTPAAPVALELAARDPSANVVYLARPCQYQGLTAPACNVRYWTDARFAPEVIHAYDDALAQLKTQTGTSGFHLVGFSGGGAIALLLASQRHDILSVRTVAGNIDHQAWTNLHQISPLTASLNPADQSEALTPIPQLHFVGVDDTVMPIAVANAYQHHFRDAHCMHTMSVPGAAHTTGWASQWPELLHTPLPCLDK